MMRDFGVVVDAVDEFRIKLATNVQTARVKFAKFIN
jgi:hypothetical protein